MGSLSCSLLQTSQKSLVLRCGQQLFIYTSIYCNLHPGRFHELLKYMSIIRLGAKRCNNLGWKHYDEQFRLRKAIDPTGSWATVDSELWLIYINDSTENKNYSTGSTSVNMNTGCNLKCYAFNYEPQVCIPSSKTDQLDKGSSTWINSQLDLMVCPVKLVSGFIKLRPPVLGLLFCHFDGSPLSRYQFVSLLKKAIKLSEIDQTRNSSHSFRIGAATTLSMEEVLDCEIMKLGRWSSNTYKGYIRILCQLTNCSKSIVGDPINVWIVGSSIVKHAFVAAQDRPDGVNLGLGRWNASLWWPGKGVMIVKHV
ncbi:unnamed protein product [Mytilus coruscus]|uniref:Tyr recombinase domain-containing protein n=1 Tax=Mytilus coruscus TaxID=42192 RepID=A0A6J8E462_MYTCO|nr:unnamed protein product [Mytilus coruscus]